MAEWTLSDRRCPLCGATLITNGSHLWCSNVGDGRGHGGCDYGIRTQITIEANDAIAAFFDSRKKSAPGPSVTVAETWAVVELMGHLRLAGRLTEEEKFGTKLGRLDIPQADGTFVTRYFGGSSVYSITIVTEDVARLAARSCHVEPVHPWELPKQLAPASRSHTPEREEDYRDDILNSDSRTE